MVPEAIRLWDVCENNEREQLWFCQLLIGFGIKEGKTRNAHCFQTVSVSQVMCKG